MVLQSAVHVHKTGIAQYKTYSVHTLHISSISRQRSRTAHLEYLTPCLFSQMLYCKITSHIRANGTKGTMIVMLCITFVTGSLLYCMLLMAVGLKVPSPTSGPSKKLELVVITPRFTVPAITVPTPGTPKVSSMMNSAYSFTLSCLNHTQQAARQESLRHTRYLLACIATT